VTVAARPAGMAVTLGLIVEPPVNPRFAVRPGVGRRHGRERRGGWVDSSALRAAPCLRGGKVHAKTGGADRVEHRTCTGTTPVALPAAVFGAPRQDLEPVGASAKTPLLGECLSRLGGGSTIVAWFGLCGPRDAHYACVLGLLVTQSRGTHQGQPKNDQGQNDQGGDGHKDGERHGDPVGTRGRDLDRRGTALLEAQPAR
jgi:hypothetical protein